ncbi:restriction endonuclease subunit S [Streptomyces sp. PU10]|uniref:restriction endonuclease subunit S n=1 Tax=Streptomyces sp. PU10 TaxID=3062780 RepID=UPI0028FC3EF4|nr:restriction endonuclease subunit S [Streptomyces sp. PU10]MDU0258454.1 restriction endonuclease subunit S [Streptomyces sp. PU10]
MVTREIPFSELLSVVIDNRGRTCPTSHEGVKLIATNCISNDALYPRYEKLRYVSQDTYDNWFRGHPDPGDLIFVCKGTPGRVAIAPDPVDFCIAQDMVAVRADRSKVNPLYLFAALRSPVVQNRIQNLHVGTMIPHFKKGDFGRLNIPVPEYEDQIGIGRIYLEISRKIDINERIVDVADQLLRSIYQDACSHTSDSIAMSKLGSLVRKGVSASSLTGDEHYIGLEHMPRRNMWLTAWQEDAEIVSGKSAFESGDVLFGKLRPYFHKVGLALTSGVCSTDILVVRPVEPSRLGWLLLSLSSDEVIAHASAVSDGTRMPRTKWKDLEALDVPWPGEAQVARMNEVVRSMGARIQSAAGENRTLATLRDTLLPQLMSGRLRVKDAEKIVEDHV